MALPFIAALRDEVAAEGWVGAGQGVDEMGEGETLVGVGVFLDEKLVGALGI